MTAIKRASWIEGISKSNRILRDLAEILTTANRNEEGISKEENWELVYPRPFEEFKVERGTLLQDVDQPRHYIPVIDRQEVIELYDGIDATLAGKDIVKSTIIVRSEDLSVTYELDKDYTYDAATASISRVDGGAIAASARLTVTYGSSVAKILESVPVKVEKVLTIANPDREINGTDYTIDYTNGIVTFNVDPPADAAYFALTFTDIRGPYAIEDKELVALEKDLLDPLGRTFRLPTTATQVGTFPIHTREVASATVGPIGLGGSTIAYTFDPIAHTVTFSLGAPVISEKQSIWINTYEYIDPPVFISVAPRRLQLIKDPAAAEGVEQYKIIGATNKLNDGMPHRIEIDTETIKPTFFRHLSSLHAGYEELSESAYTVNFGGGDSTLTESPKLITFLDVEEDLRMSFYARQEDDLSVGIEKITDRVVLRTTTQSESLFEPVIGDSYGAADLAESLTMYLEITKPARLVNPETGLERYVDYKGVQHETQRNNHYIMTRMFNTWDDENQQPQKDKYATNGEVSERGAFISDWSKYSWFKDWKEYMVDEIDDDSGSANVQDGVTFKEVEVDGMDAEFPIQFWISTNNNRTAMILMGDPTLDQDNFLTSFAYFGRIHPFYDKECAVKKDADGVIMLDAKGDPIIEELRTYFQNDVSGNFAMTTGSSTLPVSVGAAPVGVPRMEMVDMAVDENGDKLTGRLYDYTAYSYAVSYLTESGESRPTPLVDGRRVIGLNESPGSLGTSATVGIALKIRFVLPDEATGYRIYRFHDANKVAHGALSNVHSNYKLVQSVTKLDRSRTIEYIDKGDILPMERETYNAIADAYDYSLVPVSSDAFYSRSMVATATSRSFEAVTRDTYTGAILNVKFTDKWGVNTATGVSDIMMYATRSGLKYQRHVASFITTEEFMRKEKSGQSRWTGKFHLSPVYVEHSYDKQRGWLDGVMAVDDSGIEHLDDLIVDKDTPNEEVYKFFRINAPYSFFNNSANYAYGLAIIKSSLRW